MAIIKPIVFSGHETFALKHEWLCKYYSIRKNQSKSYVSDEELIVQFGVGKNMLQSIRYWARQSGLFIYDVQKNNELMIPNEWGSEIFKTHDSYLENLSSTWFIHWKMIFEGDAFTPRWLFCKNNFTSFDTQIVQTEIKNSLTKESIKVPADETIRRDIDTFLKCYCPRANKSNEVIDHLLSNLYLIIRSEDGTNRYQMTYQGRASLNYQMFVFAIIDFKNKYYSDVSTIAMERIMFDEYSPGRIFQLDESSIARYADQINSETNNKVYLDESAGVYQWVFNLDKNELNSLQIKMFKDMYK